VQQECSRFLAHALKDLASFSLKPRCGDGHYFERLDNLALEKIGVIAVRAAKSYAIVDLIEGLDLTAAAVQTFVLGGHSNSLLHRALTAALNAMYARMGPAMRMM
jgi:hypothetical protein